MMICDPVGGEMLLADQEFAFDFFHFLFLHKNSQETWKWYVP